MAVEICRCISSNKGAHRRTFHQHQRQCYSIWKRYRRNGITKTYINSTYASLQYLSHLIITHILNIIQNSEHYSEILWSFTRSGHLPDTSDHLSDFLTTTLEWECFLLLSWPRLLVMLPASVWCHNGSKIRADRYHSTDFVRPSGILLPSIFIQLISISTHLTLYACRTGMAVLWA